MTGSDQTSLAVDVPTVRLPYADGLVVSRLVRPEAHAPGSGTASAGSGESQATGEAGGGETTWIEFFPVATAEAVHIAMRLATRTDIDAVVVHERYVPTHRTALAVAFGTRLSQARLAGGECPDVVTSAVRPDLTASPGPVGVPHLVTAREPGRPYLVDRVVWEVMAPEVFLCWLPSMAGARRTAEIESRLPRLLRMRALIRDGGLDRLPFADELGAVLGGGPMTIRAVFGEPDLFLAVADYLYDVVVDDDDSVS